MKKLSLPLLARTVAARRKALNPTQAQLAKSVGMNRSYKIAVAGKTIIHHTLMPNWR